MPGRAGHRPVGPLTGVRPTFALRAKMEAESTPQLMAVLGIDVASLPIIWDADFLYDPRSASGEDAYVLCEINVSAVWPFPPMAAPTVAAAATDLVQAARAIRRV